MGSIMKHMTLPCPTPCTSPTRRGVTFIWLQKAAVPQQDRAVICAPGARPTPFLPYPEHSLVSESTPKPSSPSVLLGSPQRWGWAQSSGKVQCTVEFCSHLPRFSRNIGLSSSPGNIFASKRTYLDRTGACQTLDHSTKWR